MKPPNINPNPKSKLIVLRFGPGKIVQQYSIENQPSLIKLIYRDIYFESS